MAGKKKKTKTKTATAKKPARKKATGKQPVVKKPASQKTGPAKSTAKKSSKSPKVKKKSSQKNFVKKTSTKKTSTKKTERKTPVAVKAIRQNKKKLLTKDKKAITRSKAVESQIKSSEVEKENLSSVKDSAPKPAKKTRKKKSSAEPIGPSAEESKQWEKLLEQNKEEKAIPYNMKKTFESVSSIEHKSFGRGFIISQYNNRLKVLFKDGTKTLISNYQNK